MADLLTLIQNDTSIKAAIQAAIPYVISGTPQVGSTLSVPADPRASFQWSRAGAALPLALGSTYQASILDYGQAITCTRTVGAVVTTTPAVTVTASQALDTDVATTGFYGEATYPSSAYDATSGYVFTARQAWNPTTQKREARVSARNPANAMSLVSSATAWIDQLNSDDHGCPSIAADYQGYLHCFGGTHNSGAAGFQYSRSTNPRDPSAWTAVNVGGSGTQLSANCAYAHPVAYGQSLALLFRQLDTGGANTMRGIVITGPVSSGVWTPGTAVKVFDFGSDANGSAVGAGSRCYIGETKLKAGSTVIYMVITFADFQDDYRQDCYFCGYDTATGNVVDVTGNTVITPANFPISRATMRSSFLVRDQLTLGRFTNIQAFDFDASGNPHVLLLEGATSAAPQTGVAPSVPFNVCHTYWTGSAWSVPVVIGKTDSRYNESTIYLGANGMEAVWPAVNGFIPYVMPRGGDMVKAVRTGTTWGTPVQVASASSQFQFDRATSVRFGPANARVVFSENTQVVGGNPLDNTGGNLRTYAAGDSGIIFPSFQPRAQTTAWANRLSAAPAALVQAVDECIGSLIALGLWSILDALYLPVANQADSLLNVVQNAYNMTLSGGVTFTPYQGWKGDGSTGVLNTGFIPSSAAAANYTLNSSMLGAWGLTESQQAAYDVGLAGAGATAAINFRSTTGVGIFRANDGAALSPTTQGSAVGLFYGRRTGAAARDVWQNGVQIALDTSASTSLETSAITLLQNNTGYSARQIGLAFFGAPVSFANMPAVYLIFRRLLIAFGSVN